MHAGVLKIAKKACHARNRMRTEKRDNMCFFVALHRQHKCADFHRIFEFIRNPDQNLKPSYVIPITHNKK